MAGFAGRVLQWVKPPPQKPNLLDDKAALCAMTR
jgi:hypothetical protein